MFNVNSLDGTEENKAMKFIYIYILINPDS